MDLPGKDWVGYQCDTNTKRSRFREELFTRWASGTDPVQQRINIFSHIRDIPYAIVPQWRGSDDPEQLMIQENRGWCGPKHHLLSWMLIRLGIDVRMVIIPFRWKDQPVPYPDPLRAIINSLPDTTHLCCRAYLDGAWRLVDATWDLPLKDAGFPVNHPWDGISDTIPAVIGINPAENDVNRPQVRSAGGQGIAFTTGLNRWMEEIRKQRIR